VIVVHLYGQAADMDAIMAIAARHGIAVIEDCAQAHGATWRGAHLGTLTEAAAFSLYPTKNLGALGDAGIVATRDADLAERITALRQYGWRRRYISDLVGINSRLDEVQAAVLRARLPHLDAQNARRATIAARYDAVAGDRAPARRPEATHVFHQYVIRSDVRDNLQAALRAAGVGTGVHYPVPVHRQPAYEGRVALGPAGCMATEHAAAEVLSLPMFPELTERQVDQVCAALATHLG
jgi:dTDP-4-amino-4,6-dideoxygalactose transaminase